MTARRPALPALLLAALLAAAPTGCGPRLVALDQVTIHAAPDANANNAVAIDLVLADDPALDATLATLPAGEWFRRRAQVLRDYPEGVTVLSWELVPGQRISAPVRRKAAGVYLFAAYASPGDHRTRLGFDRSEVTVTLQAEDFVLDAADRAE